MLDRLQSEVLRRGVLFPLSQEPRTSVVTSRVHATRLPVYAPEDWGPRLHYLWAGAGPRIRGRAGIRGQATRAG